MTHPSRKLVTGRNLAAVLGVQPDTIRYQWPEMLPPIIMYDAATVNKVLAAAAVGFDHPPTIDDLLEGRIELIDAAEVNRLAPRLTPKKLARRGFRQKHLASVKLGTSVSSVVRYSKASVLAYVATAESFTTIETCHILGLRKWATVNSELVKTGKLAVSTNPDDNNHLLVSRASLIACLRGLLSTGIDPEDWIDDRSVDPDPLRSLPQAADYIGVSIPALRKLVNEGRFPYIFTPAKKERLFSTEQLLVYAEQFPLKKSEVVHYFGISAASVTNWKTGLPQCTVHRHTTEGVLYEACMVAIIRPLLSPGMEVLRWCRRRRGASAEPLVPLRKASYITGFSMLELEHYAKAGRLHGVNAPYGGWRFVRQSLDALVESERGSK